MLREFSAGGVVFKSEKSKALWLVTSSAPSRLYPKSFWRFPKGWLDDTDVGRLPGPLASGEKKASEEQLEKAAIREVVEESGIKARIIKKIGTERYFLIRGNEKVMKFVTYYLMEWVADLPEGHDQETEEVIWLPFAEARKRLSFSSSKKVLDQAKALLV